MEISCEKKNLSFHSLWNEHVPGYKLHLESTDRTCIRTICIPGRFRRFGRREVIGDWSCTCFGHKVLRVNEEHFDSFLEASVSFIEAWEAWSGETVELIKLLGFGSEG